MRVSGWSPATWRISGAATVLAALVLVGVAQGGTGAFVLGENFGDDEEYTLNAGELLDVHTSTIGEGGTGTFHNLGGEHRNIDNLTLGLLSSGKGVYDMGSGEVSCDDLYIGRGGTGTFTQHNGSVTSNTNQVELGYGLAAFGTYTLKAGSLSSHSMTVGRSGAGEFCQEGGDLTLTGDATLGREAGSSGHLEMSSGTATSGRLTIGYKGTGTFVLSGGHFTATNDILLGWPGGGVPGEEGTGILSITEGTLTAEDKAFVVHSTDSYITDLDHSPHPVGGLIEVGENFHNKSLMRFSYSTAHTTIHLHTRQFQPHSWEVRQDNVIDLGPVPEGYNDNFAIGELVLGMGTDAYTQEYHLGSDLYVYGLSLLSDASLDLNGHTIYYLKQGSRLNGIWGRGFIDAGDFENGQILGVIPEPATLALVALGGVGALLRCRR